MTKYFIIIKQYKRHFINDNQFLFWISVFLFYFNKINLDDRLDVVKLFYKSGESATLTLRAFKKLRNLKKDPHSTTAITNLINKLNETKSLHDIPKSGRPSLIDERKEEVVSTMEKFQAENVLGHATCHSVSKICKIPQRSVC